MVMRMKEKTLGYWPSRPHRARQMAEKNWYEDGTSTWICTILNQYYIISYCFHHFIPYRRLISRDFSVFLTTLYTVLFVERKSPISLSSSPRSGFFVGKLVQICYSRNSDYYDCPSLDSCASLRLEIPLYAQLLSSCFFCPHRRVSLSSGQFLLGSRRETAGEDGVSTLDFTRLLLLYSFLEWFSSWEQDLCLDFGGDC